MSSFRAKLCKMVSYSIISLLFSLDLPVRLNAKLGCTIFSRMNAELLPSCWHSNSRWGMLYDCVYMTVVWVDPIAYYLSLTALECLFEQFVGTIVVSSLVLSIHWLLAAFTCRTATTSTKLYSCCKLSPGIGICLGLIKLINARIA